MSNVRTTLKTNMVRATIILGLSLPAQAQTALVMGSTEDRSLSLNVKMIQEQGTVDIIGATSEEVKSTSIEGNGQLLTTCQTSSCIFQWQVSAMKGGVNELAFISESVTGDRHVVYAKISRPEPSFSSP